MRINATSSSRGSARSDYLTKLLSNDAVKSYIQRYDPEILEHFELVVNTVSMEGAVQQQHATGFASDPEPE